MKEITMKKKLSKADENLTYDEMAELLAEIKRTNAKLEKENQQLQHALGRQNREIVDLQMELQADEQRINFLFDSISEVNSERLLIEASLSGELPIKPLRKAEAANQSNFTKQSETA